MTKLQLWRVAGLGDLEAGEAGEAAGPPEISWKGDHQESGGYDGAYG